MACISEAGASFNLRIAVFLSATDEKLMNRKRLKQIALFGE
jgi:hypothetical protein